MASLAHPFGIMCKGFAIKFSQLAHPVCKPFNLAVASSPFFGLTSAPDKTAMDETNDHANQELLDDVDKWESRELGADPRHARRGRPREEIDAKLGLTKLTLRLKAETVDELARQADDEGLMLGALIRRILEAHANPPST